MFMEKRKAIYKTLHKYGGDILNAESFQKSRKYVQHGTFSVWRHSLNVAETSIKLSHALPFRFSEKELVRGALLHDYFQYDWHKKRVGIREIREFYKMHGFTQEAYVATDNQTTYVQGGLGGNCSR